MIERGQKKNRSLLPFDTNCRVRQTAFARIFPVPNFKARTIMRTARTNMIENQIRAGGVYLQNVFDSLDAIRREDFVPLPYSEYAYADMEIPLPYGQNMLTPLTEALVLQAVSVNKNDMVLEIGTGSGYMAALLAHGARHVTTVEIEPGLKNVAANNLARYGVENVHVVCENGLLIERYAPDSLFDVIVFSGAVSFIPETFMNRLANNGRMVVFHENDSFIQALLLQKKSSDRPEYQAIIRNIRKILERAASSFSFSFLNRLESLSDPIWSKYALSLCHTIYRRLHFFSQCIRCQPHANLHGSTCK